MNRSLFIALVALAACSSPATQPTTSASPIAAVPPMVHDSLRLADDIPRPTFLRTGGPGSLDRPLTSQESAWVENTLKTLTLRQKVGQMVHVWVLGDYTSTSDSSFAEVLRWIRQDQIGGVSMSLGTPIEVAAKVNYMQSQSRIPLFVSADLEPGLGRLEGGVFSHYLMDAGSATVFPNNMAIAATGRDSDAYDVGRVIAEEARAVGINIVFGPVVDVNNNPFNPVINTRSFGEDPKRVARLAALFVKGLQDQGAIATAKHFPGHGDTDVDSHVGLPVVAANITRLDTLELVPFRAAIGAGAQMVMSAHIALPAISGDSAPATLTPGVMSGLLRDSLKFTGVAITDAMTMEGVGKGYTTEKSSVMAIQAGADILLKPSDPTRAINAVVAAVERGEITRERIDASVRRILTLKTKAGVIGRPIVSLDALRDVVGSSAHRSVAEGIGERAITLVRDRESLLASRPPRTLVVQYMPETELKAGRTFDRELRRVGPITRTVKITPSTTAMTLDSIAQFASGVDRVIVAAYVRRVEGEGRAVIPRQVADWIDVMSTRRPTVVVAFGNPYLLRQFPRVGTYLTAFGVGDALERGAARVVAGRVTPRGVAPVTLGR